MVSARGIENVLYASTTLLGETVMRRGRDFRTHLMGGALRRKGLGCWACVNEVFAGCDIGGTVALFVSVVCEAISDSVSRARVSKADTGTDTSDSGI